MPVVRGGDTVIYDRPTSIFFKHINHACGLINNQILHYKPISLPSEQVLDELLFLCEIKKYDYLPLIKKYR